MKNNGGQGENSVEVENNGEKNNGGKVETNSGQVENNGGQVENDGGQVENNRGQGGNNGEVQFSSGGQDSTDHYMEGEQIVGTNQYDPSAWDEFFDEETQHPYYVNLLTGDTSWEIPGTFS